MATMTKTTAGLNAERNAKSGVTNPKVFYIALGDDATAPSASDTKLGNERFRKAITSYANGATGIITAQIYIEPTEAVGITVREVGVFVGSTATSSANSGIMLARMLYSPEHPKLGTENMVIPVQITYS